MPGHRLVQPFVGYNSPLRITSLPPAEVTPPPISDGLAKLERDCSAGDDQIDGLRADIEENFAIQDVLELVAKGLTRGCKLSGQTVHLHGGPLSLGLPDILKRVDGSIIEVEAVHNDFFLENLLG